MNDRYNDLPPAGNGPTVWEAAAERAEARRLFSRVGISLVVLLTARELSGWAISLLIRAAAPSLLSTWWLPWILSFVPLYGVGLPCMLLSLRGIGKAPRNEVCRVRGTEVPMPGFHFGWWMLILIIAFGCMEFGALAGNGIMAALSELTGYDYKNALGDLIGQTPLWMVALGTGILAPLGEEFVFRKVLIDRTRRYGDTVSVLISAAFFALFHLNLFQFFYAFLLGLLLAYLYTRTGQLRWCVALHAAANLWGGVLSAALNRAVDLERMTSADQAVYLEYLTEHPLTVLCYLVYGMAAYAFMAAAVVLVIVLRRRVRLGQGSVRLGTKGTAGAVFANFGVLLALIVCVGLTVYALIPVPPVPAA